MKGAVYILRLLARKFLTCKFVSSQLKVDSQLGPRLLIIVENATAEVMQAAWQKAHVGPDDDGARIRFDRYGARMDWEKCGDMENQFGWILIENEFGTLETVNVASSPIGKARQVIEGLKETFDLPRAQRRMGRREER